MTTLQIVLATYQGQQFLATQLESLLRQTNTEFELITADDGSTDGTQAILADYAQRYPGKIWQLPASTALLGAPGNFARLTQHLTADYAMFCDQDDVWLTDKIARSLAAMRAAEATAPPGTPILIHTDMAMVAADLTPIRSSFWRARHMRPTRSRLAHLLIENSTAGCTMLANRALYELARPIPPQATMHDHWLALVAAAFGRLVYLDGASLLFRRHDRTESQQPLWRPILAAKRLADTADGRAMAQIEALSRQAAAFLDRHGSRLPGRERAAVTALAGLSTLPRRRRVPALIHHRLLKSDWRRNLLLFLTVMRAS